jgi:superfamily II DNA or RNA helicase
MHSTSAVADEDLVLDTEMLAAEGVDADLASPAAPDAATRPAANAAATTAAAAAGGAAKPSAASLIARLDSMLKQSAQFRDVARKDAAATAALTKVGGGVSARHTSKKAAAAAAAAAAGERVRKTEAEEDQALLEDELADDTGGADGARLGAGGRITRQPSILTGNMRAYQMEALNWLMTLHDSRLNGILADEMGLGKTLETISLLAYLRESRGINGKHMIIVPKTTLTNWTREVRRWCPSFSIVAFHGNRDEREALKPQLDEADIIATTFEVCIIERTALRRLDFEYVIIDEAHRIKNEHSKLSLVVRQFVSRHRLLITGTPLQNNLHELWSLLNFLKPDLFGSHEEFEQFFNLTSSGSDAEREGMVAALHRVLRPFLLRRLKTEVEASLPPKVETKLFVGLSAVQREIYTKVLSRDMDALNNKGASKTQLHNMMMQLRKVCNHPYLFEGVEPGPPYTEGEHLIDASGKLLLLDKLLAKLQRDGSRVLIFSQMTRMLDILEDYCLYRGYKHCRIDGSTKQDERDDAMDSFNAPGSEKFVFLLSTRAGGLGINLQTADTVVLYDSDWNPQMDLQAQDRAHRIGQKRQVNVYRFVTEHSIEEKIVDRALRKLALDALIIQKGRLLDSAGGGTDKAASAAELQSIVRFGAAFIFQSRDSTITDDDIDAILARGKELTAEQAAKLQATSTDSLLNFSFVAEDGQFNTLEFEGKNYGEDGAVAGPDGLPLPYIEPPQRERKVAIYDINTYYRQALNPGAELKQKSGPREWRPAVRPDFQFFNTERLNELEKRHWHGEQTFKAARSERLRAMRERRRAEAEAGREARKAQRRAERAAGGGDDDDSESSAGDNDDEEEGEGETATQLPSPAAGAGVKVEAATVKAEGAAAATAAATAAAAAAADGGVKNEVKSEPMGDSGAAAAAAAAATTAASAATATGATVSRSKRSAADAGAATDKKAKKADGSSSGTVDGESDDDNDGEDEDDKKKVPATAAAAAAAQAPIELSDEEAAQMRVDAGCLTNAEAREMRALQAEGFTDWRRSDLQQFITACATFGRRDLARIAVAVEGRTAEEVRRYHKVFWARHGELKDGDKLVKQVERGEAIVQRKKDIEKVLDLKVARCPEPVSGLSLEYPTKQLLYTEDEDRFLVLAMRHQGFGNWDAIRRDVLLAPQFRFDWFFKSRTPAELAKRCEFLLRALEKEIEAGAGKKAAGSKAKAASAGAAAEAVSSKKGGADKADKAEKEGGSKKGSGDKKAASSTDKKAAVAPAAKPAAKKASTKR